MITPHHAFRRVIPFLVSLLMAKPLYAQALGPSSYNESCTATANSTVISSLTDFTNYHTCTTVYNPVRIMNDSIIQLDLYNIEEFKSSFIVKSCLLLKTINGPNVTTIQLDFALDSLPSLDALLMPHLRSVGEVLWQELQSLSSFPSLTTITGSLLIKSSSITGLSLPLLESVASLTITDNMALSSLNLHNLKSINGDFRVIGNPLLLELDQFSQFDRATGSLEFRGKFSTIRLREPKSNQGNQPPLALKSIKIYNTYPSYDCIDFRDAYITPGGILAAPSSSFTCWSPLNTVNATPTALAVFNSANQNGLKEEVLAVIFAFAFFGLIAIFLTTRFHLKKRKLKAAREQEEIELAAMNADNDEGVVRARVEGEDDDLPGYTRVAKKGEVPPMYGEVLDGDLPDEPTVFVRGLRSPAALREEGRVRRMEAARRAAVRVGEVRNAEADIVGRDAVIVDEEAGREVRRPRFAFLGRGRRAS